VSLTPTGIPCLKHLLPVALTALAVAACGPAAGPGAAGAAKDTTAAGQKVQPALLISPEDLLTVRSDALGTGPTITGSVQPERRADLRAEVPAVVLSVLKENGDPVRRGDLLVRLDDTAIRDTLTAADSAAAAASQAFEQAERQYQRLVKLRQDGLVSVQQVEDAETRRNGAQSDREAARTRVVAARQQLERTQVRAPFDGIISDRKVSAGDTAQVGKELLKVIDPRSLRFEGFVSADSVGDVHAGQAVVFSVHGYAQREFAGHIKRVNPAANTTTRQVEVLVGFADAREQPNVAGLYAEGRVEAGLSTALTLPASAIVNDGDRAFAWRIDKGTLDKVALQLGERDARSGRYVIRKGLAQGDRVLRYPTSALRTGQAVVLTAQAGSTANATGERPQATAGR
jgi:RND family efflux transporter MFP subunit